MIDTRLSTPLFNLPRVTIPGVGGPTSLPQRNLLRHFTWELPSGQRIAREMNAPSLSRGDLAELQPYGHDLDSSTPLWYYILKEAEVMEDGRRLGLVGGRIVGEVIIGLLQLSSRSFLASNTRLAADSADAERASYRRLPHGRLSHICRCRPHQPRPVIPRWRDGRSAALASHWRCLMYSPSRRLFS